MDLHELAEETAEKQAASEAEAFEQATSCIVPEVVSPLSTIEQAVRNAMAMAGGNAEFKVNDEVEQAFRAGLTARKSCCDDLRIEQIAAHYGFTSQADMLCEESAEYMVALNKLRRGKSEAYENIKEEVADVLIVARQLRYLLGYEDIDRIISQKLDRQMQRIANEEQT